ncbi:virB8 family protein [Neisseria sp. 83E34]|uniref:virB8 family protein n=1 Tax=Neisseria sp. 83E34 TaxID=1692264 RepID=UPI0006CE8940|nr:type IV secretion system protein [Neisseria sp. 83E34]KPN72614.1 type VI secretion protein [Neisseria sp. 83E34]
MTAQTTNPKNGGKNARNKKALDFIDAAKAFEKSEIEMVRRNSKIAWRISGGCLLLVGLLAGAIAGLTPLKEVKPFVIRVDNNTGVTDIVTSVKKKEESYGEVVDKFFLSQYIRYREGYDWQTIQDSYDATMLLSAPTVQAEFSKIYHNNPDAPHLKLRGDYKVVAKVNAITFIGKTAQIRFEKQRIPVTGDLDKVIPAQKMIATISFDYTDKPFSEKDRLVNPLGFQVNSYRVDPENTP